MSKELRRIIGCSLAVCLGLCAVPTLGDEKSSLVNSADCRRCSDTRDVESEHSQKPSGFGSIGRNLPDLRIGTKCRWLDVENHLTRLLGAGRLHVADDKPKGDIIFITVASSRLGDELRGNLKSCLINGNKFIHSRYLPYSYLVPKRQGMFALCIIYTNADRDKIGNVGAYFEPK